MSTLENKLTALEAAGFQLVTIFHPNRPPVKWSNVANLLATTYGCSYDVEVVTAKFKCLVTLAMAEIGYCGVSLQLCTLCESFCLRSLDLP